MADWRDDLTKDEKDFVKALETMAPTSVEVMTLALLPDLQNPLDYLDLEPYQRRFVFERLFNRLLARDTRWANLRKALARLALDIAANESANESLAKEAREETAPLEVFESIAIGYCTKFKHKRFLDRFLPPLDCAHRGPVLCASRLIEDRGSLVATSTDEWLKVPPIRALRGKSASIFYLSTHGRIAKNQYQAALYDSYWQPSSSDFSVDGPKVLVLDTCHGANRTPPYQNFWSAALQGTSVRLLLACEGPIVMDRLSTKRGYAFADNLLQPQTSIADAWLRAVRSTSTTGMSRPIAIGLGNSAPAAKAMLELTFSQLCSETTRPASLSPSSAVHLVDRH